jgi:hypothetical protein
MNYYAPTPECISSTEISDGYQLCARCGNVLVDGESAFVVPRISSWLIYTHEVGPDCPAKAVNGWKTVRNAEAVRGTNNVETVRDAGHFKVGGSIRPWVCVLDDEHIDAELEPGDYQTSQEAVSKGADLRTILSRAKNRIEARDTFNTVENTLIAAIDQSILDQNLDALLECVWSCRRRTYAAIKPEPPSEPDFLSVGRELTQEGGVR